MGMRMRKSNKIPLRALGPQLARQSAFCAESLESRLMLSAAAANQQAQENAVQFLNNSSAVFVQNEGQWSDDAIKFAYSDQGVNIGFTDTGPVLDLLKPAKPAPVSPGASPLSRPATPPEVQSQRIAVSFECAQVTAPVGIDRSSTSFNYLIGDASKHRSNVASYEQISYPNLYAGIDLLTWAQPSGMKYEFHAAPGADWRNIRVRYNGAQGMSIAGDGSLHIATRMGDLVEQAPLIYQMIGGTRTAVSGKFVLIDSDTYAFAITGHYDPARELIIDPDLSWAASFGGDFDVANAVAVDPATGNVYVTGFTTSSGWGTPNAYQPVYTSATDAFVAKFNPSGTALLYATYFGAPTKSYVEAQAIAVNSAGEAYITGVIGVGGLATSGAYQTTMGGVQDAFVAKFTASGSLLLYCTYLGGDQRETAYAIALDPSGDAYVTGITGSAGWATDGAYNQTFQGGVDVFVAKLNPSGSSLLYATFLGGSGSDWGTGIALDSSGGVYISGFTSSSGWATDGAFDTTALPSNDVFVAKLSPSGSALVYATYLGLNSSLSLPNVAIDRLGNACVTGETTTAGWATPGAYQVQYAGGIDDFVAKISANGASLIWGTYLGGAAADYSNAIALDGDGNVYVAGETYSAGGATAGAYDTSQNGNSDIFIARLNPQGSSLQYATYIGGSGRDAATGIAIDASGNAYLAGDTGSLDWTMAENYGWTHGSGELWPFVLKFSGLVDLYPGDTNGDGIVNFADLVAVAQNYGGSDKSRAQGDLNGDGEVSFADLVMVAQNYGNTLVPNLPPAASAIPKPKPPALTPNMQPSKKVSIQR